MKAVITQGEWEEYQELKREKVLRKPDPLTGKIITRAEVARPRVGEYVARNLSGSLQYWSLLSPREKTVLTELAMSIAEYTFEQCTGEKY